VVAPLLISFPRSLEGEGDKGGEGDNKSRVHLAISFFPPSHPRLVTFLDDPFISEGNLVKRGDSPLLAPLLGNSLAKFEKVVLLGYK